MRNTDVNRIIWTTIWVCCLITICLYFSLFAERGSEYSPGENRQLEGFPKISASSIMDGSFMESFEKYLLDRFPGRSRAVLFTQTARDSMSFADYVDYLAVASVQNDPLTSLLSEQNEDSSVDPPSPQGQQAMQPHSDAQDASPSAPQQDDPPHQAEGDPTDSHAAEQNTSDEASGMPFAQPDSENPAVNRVFPEKPEPDAEDYPQAMGVYMAADSRLTTLLSYGRSRVIDFTGVLNRFADVLPEGGCLSFTMVPQSSYANLFANANGREAMYSDFEQCVYAFSRDNVFVTSTANMLGSALIRGEYVYFRTDMHWTPYGTYLVYSDMVSAIGFEPTPYEDFEMTVESPFLGTYYRDNPTGYMRNNADYLDLIRPKFPHEFLRVTAPGSMSNIPLLDENARANDRYTVYLGGPAGPWSIIRSENGMTDNCLVLTDSFGLAFVPMLTGQYKEVHYYDPRYFNAAATGGSVSQLIELYDIKDIFVVVGDLHSFNSDFIYQAADQLQ